MNRFLVFTLAIFLFTVFQACEENPGADHTHTGVDQQYTCPMHPQVVSDQPSSCPVCGMDLVPVKIDDSESLAVMLSERQIRLANISTQAVSNDTVENAIPILGRVAINQEATEIISSRVEGRIEKLNIQETGERIQAGEALYTIYSEPLLTLQREFLLALEQAGQLGDQDPRFHRFLESARKKLLLYGLTEGQVKRLGQTGNMDANITFVSPVSGIVSEISVSEGQYVQEGGVLYKVDRLDRVWVVAELYPGEAELVKKGDEVRVRVTGFENEPLTGKVSFISPQYNRGSQVLNLRIEIANPGHKFLPGMQAKVILENAQKEVIAIPTGAVIRSGEGAHVWIKAGEGTFKPRLVETGLVNANSIEITSGLRLSDTVVVSGAYLLYSDYKLKKGGDFLKALENVGTDPATSSGTGMFDAEMEIPEEIEVNSRFRQEFLKIFEQYIKLKDQLVASESIGAGKAARDMGSTIHEMDETLLTGEAFQVWDKMSKEMLKSIQSLSKGQTLDVQRTAFHTLSKILFHGITQFGDGEIVAYYQYCPMALGNTGGYWLSTHKEIRNPYYGTSMLTCGETRQTLN